MTKCDVIHIVTLLPATLDFWLGSFSCNSALWLREVLE